MRRHARTLGLIVLLGAPAAAADGEYGPMIGGSVVATRGVDDGLAGGEVEAVLWHGRLGLAVAASRQVGVAGNGQTVTAVDGSLRLLVVRHLIPSLLEPRDVELGVELQGIVERSWWNNLEQDRPPVSYGVGLAVRMRGGTDNPTSNLLAESRLFVRALMARQDGMEVVAREGGTARSATDRELTIVIGLGAMFGGGQPRYLERFRPRPPDFAILPVR